MSSSWGQVGAKLGTKWVRKRKENEGLENWRGKSIGKRLENEGSEHRAGGRAKPPGRLGAENGPSDTGRLSSATTVFAGPDFGRFVWLAWTFRQARADQVLVGQKAMESAKKMEV